MARRPVRRLDTRLPPASETVADLRRQLQESHVIVAAILVAVGRPVTITAAHIHAAYDSKLERHENWDHGGALITFRAVPRRPAV